jgi:hypothetical protein
LHAPKICQPFRMVLTGFSGGAVPWFTRYKLYLAQDREPSRA